MPDSRIWGMRTKNALWIACPAVCEIVEMNTPMPRTTKRKIAAPRANVRTLPLNGTSNSSTPSTVTTIMSAAARRKYGAILPRITVLGAMGITASCSNVPASRSRTRPMLVMIVPMNVRISPMIAGTMTHDVSRSGL